MKTEKANPVEKLRESVRLLEARRETEEKELKEQFLTTYENLKPINMIKSSMKDLVGSKELQLGLLRSVLPVLSGCAMRKAVVRTSRNPLVTIAGTLLQYGVSNAVSRNIDFIRDFLIVQADKFSRFTDALKKDDKEES